MASQSTPIPLPGPERKKLVQGEVTYALYEAVMREMARKPKRVKMTEVIAWGLEMYLLAANPQAAAELGIFPEKKVK